MKTQLEIHLAQRLARRFNISFAHALTIVELARLGTGGRA